jgi:hypothetical protein
MKRRLSHETIYQYIWRDKANGGSLWRHLRQSSKQRRKRYKSYDSRGRLAEKRHISERPKSVEGRRYKGHWEIDTVHGRGSNHCIVTLLERKTGYVLIGKLRNKSTHALNKNTVRPINRDRRNVKTITADNGTEFHQYKRIEDCCSVKFYFANPYHSWECGSNENVSGVIRQYLPKTDSMAHVTQQQCDAIAKKLNVRPRKRFGSKTPEEIYYGISVLLSHFKLDTRPQSVLAEIIDNVYTIYERPSGGDKTIYIVPDKAFLIIHSTVDIPSQYYPSMPAYTGILNSDGSIGGFSDMKPGSNAATVQSMCLEYGYICTISSIKLHIADFTANGKGNLLLQGLDESSVVLVTGEDGAMVSSESLGLNIRSDKYTVEISDQNNDNRDDI